MKNIGKAHIEALKALQKAKESSSISEDVIKDIKENHKKNRQDSDGRKEDLIVAPTRKKNPEVSSSSSGSYLVRIKKASIRRFVGCLGAVVILYLSALFVLLSGGYLFPEYKLVRYYANGLSAWLGWQPFENDVVSQSLILDKDMKYIEDSMLDGTSDDNFRQEIRKVTFCRYNNGRFGYTILYPSFLLQGEEADNGDGCRFMMGNDIYLSVFGENNTFDESIKEKYDIESERHKCDDHSLTYRRLKKNWFVLSGYQSDGRIYYQKTVLYYSRNTGLDAFVTAILCFPAKYKNEFDPIIKKIFTGFPNK